MSATIGVFILALVAILGQPLEAGIVTYSNQSAFDAALAPGFYTESFAGPVGTLTNPQFFSGGAFSYQASTTAGSSLFRSLTGGVTALSTSIGADPVIISNFGGAPSAIGGLFFFDDNGGNIAPGAAGTITVSNGIDPDTVSTVTSPTSLTNFVGFISTSGPINSLTYIRTSAPGTGFPDIAQLTVGVTATAIPEPASAALIGMGLVALAGFVVNRSRADR